MAKYKKYAEYKDSGVEWLGLVPEHWVVTKLKYVKSEESNAFVDGPFGSNLKSEHFIDNGDVYVIESNFATTGRLNIDDLKTISTRHFETINRSEAKGGDIILAKIGARYGSSAILPTLSKKAVVSGNSLKLTINSKICDIKYVLHLLGHLKHEGAMDDGVNGSAQPALSLGGLNCLPFLLPSFLEQTGIVNFLDHETVKIDTLIAKQEKLIELLKEKRQAVISHAVTKGLNPDVEMKNSGVEWLGQVPEHWIVKSYRHASKIYRGKFGHRPRNDPAFYDGEYPFIQTGDVARAGKYITSYSQTLNEKGKEVSQLFPKGTLMMAIAANIGDLAILGFEAYAPDSVVGFKPNEEIDLEFLRYSFMAALPALEQTSTQSTQANLNVERIGAVHGVFPSFDEQKEIVSYLDEMLDKYSIIQNEMNKAINLLQERRTALISSAVTGKIDVRNWQSPNNNNNEAKMEFGA